jgi:hypothetical protein
MHVAVTAGDRGTVESDKPHRSRAGVNRVSGFAAIE